MRYANPDTIYRHIFDDDFDPNDVANASIVAEVEEMESGIAALIDLKCNRVFDALVTETRDVSYPKHAVDGSSNLGFYEYGAWWFDMVPASTWGFVYSMPSGVKNVTAVHANGSWDGSVWADEETLDVDDYRLVYQDLDGWSHGILVPNLSYVTLRVTGSWEDGAESATVPPEIVTAANLLLIDEWRTNEMSPIGEVGPGGLVTYLRDPWRRNIVQTAIEKNTFRQIVV